MERQDKEGAAAMGEWGIFSHPAEKGRHAWTDREGHQSNVNINTKDLKLEENFGICDPKKTFCTRPAKTLKRPLCSRG